MSMHSSTLDIGFDEAPSIDALLVDLHDAQRRFLASSRDKRSLNRQHVVHAVAQILETQADPYQQNMVADVLNSLVRQAERDLRESISERLCVMDNVPEDLILYLAHDVISVAKPVLAYSPVLTETDLLYIIQSKSPEYWQAIAERKKLDTDVVNALVDRKDEATVYNLLQNNTIKLGSTAIETFAELSKYSDKLAEPLLRRSEIPQRVAMDLYWHVSANLRSQIAENFEIPKENLDAALQDALEDFSDTAHKTDNPRPSALMLDLARQYAKLNRIDDAMLVKTLRRGHTRFFVALMAERSNLSPDTIQEIMRQVGGQGMAIACKAINVTKENFVSLFLLSRSLTRNDQSVDALELRKALKYFDAISADFAASIMADTILKQ